MAALASVPPRVALPAASAVLVAGTVVGVGLLGPDGTQPVVADAAPTQAVTSASERTDEDEVSRSAIRLPMGTVTNGAGKPARTKQKQEAPRTTAAAQETTQQRMLGRADVTGHLWLTEDLNVWTGPGESYRLLEVLPTGTKVAVTGEVADGQWAEIRHEGMSRWVNADYLSEQEPYDPSTGGLSAEPCASGSDVESGLSVDAVAVHRAVCAAFPEITVYGGLRSDGEHGMGLALDIMVSGSLGDQVAEFLHANAGALGVSELIWSQQIWTVERSSEGWRYMEDRGSTTANHYDHVHVTVYGAASQ